MGDRDFSHTGIDLDVISIGELINNDEGVMEEPLDTIASDPEDFRVYLSGLLKRMQGREAFLTFSQQVNNVNLILGSDYSSAKDIAQVILKDPGLTAQVLKLVNSPVYRQFSKKNGISTISEAMIILGSDEIRQLAAGLKIFEMMKSTASSGLLKDKMLKSLHRSAIARQIQRDKDGKASDAFPISAMLYDLGEYLVARLDPNTYIRIDIAMEDKQCSKEEAAKNLLGLTYSELGQMVALKLNLPKKIVHAMGSVALTAGTTQPIAPKDEARYLCAFIHELSNILEPENRIKSIDAACKLVDKYQGVVDFDGGQALWLTRTAMDRVVQHAGVLGIDPEFTTSRKVNSEQETNTELDQGINRVDKALAEGLSIHKIFTRLIDTMDQCFYFSRVVISILEKETNTMVPRFIRGDKRVDGFNKSMGFKIEPVSGVFNNAISQKTDIIVSDVVKEAFKQQVPSWYQKNVAVPYQVKGFGIFPVFVDGKIVSMIYVDWDKDKPAPDKKTIDHIQKFRRQMIKAFTLHSRQVVK